MGFSMFSSQTSPIAIDFGSSSVKMLQVTAGGNRPEITSAAEMRVPDSVRHDQQKLFSFYAEHLPTFLSQGKFKGKRAVVAIPSGQTVIQHMQVANIEGAKRDDLIKGQLQAQMGCSPDSVVVRWEEVAEVHREGQARTEIICFAIARDTVMRYIDLLRKNRLSVVGMHTEAMAIARAFDHLNRRDSDANVTTLYVDLGWGGTRVTIAHGKKMVFARYIPIGGRDFDKLIASKLNCDLASARVHRIALTAPIQRDAPERHAIGQAGRGAAILNVAAALASADRAKNERKSGAVADERRVGLAPPEYAADLSGQPPRELASTVDFTELVDTIADELSMCLRYHQGLFRNRPVDRAIFLGGESRQLWLCQRVVKSLRVSAQLGDPLARMSHEETPPTPDLKLDEPQPGWAVACGLSTAPTDL